MKNRVNCWIKAPKGDAAHREKITRLQIKKLQKNQYKVIRCSSGELPF